MALDVVTQQDVANILISHTQSRQSVVGAARSTADGMRRCKSLWAIAMVKVASPADQQAAGLAMAEKIAADWESSKADIATILDGTASGMINPQTGQLMTRAELLAQIAAMPDTTFA